jgi:FKBP-type peptidyl-prolyl cis-trans isomerase 2
MEVATGRVVTLEYTVRLASGGLVDSTGGCGPLAILHGAGQLHPTLEARIAGMQPGETRELRIPAEEGYGARRAELVCAVPRERLPPGLQLQVGAEYRVKLPDGRALRFRLLAIDEREIQADFNPPGAGEELIATVTVVAVRSPTPDEERRGRV